MFSTLRPFFSWIAITALSLILILTNQNPQGELLRGRFADFIITIAYPVTIPIKGFQVWRQNKELHATLAEMSIELAANLEYKLENSMLRELIGFKASSDLDLISAEVIGISSDPGIKGFTINKGRKDGIVADSPVISLKGIVGLIHRLGDSSCLVQLLSDPNLGIAGRLRRSREDGIVHSSSKGLLKFDGVPVSSSVAIGDTVLSSGLGGFFPPGIIIGYVTEFEPDANGWLWQISLVPCVEYGQLEDVFIVREAENDR
ncbi:MAG: rod shape-determining protein MreC [Calditrichaeota bacterium]|jgi:rod shape-determining protein MreC|nr:rod shape-determining protein MreC [Calditrichota bacterium]MBT7789047.1 rod shape-determining protein MreC [Calditrichota bacterium]